MSQPVPKITAEHVERVLRRDFANSLESARALLNLYGNETWQPETDRVRLACLKLAAGNIKTLESAVNNACVDYRDVLAWAEYPASVRMDGANLAEKKQATEADWKQYQDWYLTGAQPPPASPLEVKKQLRKVLRLTLPLVFAEKGVKASQSACESFLAHKTYQDAKSILLYVPLQGELDVRTILDRAQLEGKQVALPRFMPEQSRYAAFFIGDKPLQPGPYGVLEPDASLPISVNRLDLIVVPGLGFDARGRRLGRGKGFYDRLLAEAGGIVKCGICFDEQLLPEIPAEPHDVAVDFIATPSRWLDCRGASRNCK